MTKCCEECDWGDILKEFGYNRNAMASEIIRLRSTPLDTTDKEKIQMLFSIIAEINALDQSSLSIEQNTFDASNDVYLPWWIHDRVKHLVTVGIDEYYEAYKE